MLRRWGTPATVLLVAFVAVVYGVVSSSDLRTVIPHSSGPASSSQLVAAQSQPSLTSAQVANFADSMSLSSPGQLSLFSFATGGTSSSSVFSIGNFATGVDTDGYIAAALGVTGSSSDSFATSENYYTMGGAEVSGFNYYGELSRLYIPPTQPTTTFSFSFKLPEPALVVFMATAGGQDYLSLSGAPGITVDASWNQPGGSAVTVANASLSAAWHPEQRRLGTCNRIPHARLPPREGRHSSTL
jgi:hypothetical protein